jgi:hypothetical protein
MLDIARFMKLSGNYGIVEPGEPLVVYLADKSSFDKWFDEIRKNFNVTEARDSSVFVDESEITFFIDKHSRIRYKAIKSICEGLRKRFGENIQEWDGKLHVMPEGVYECILSVKNVPIEVLRSTISISEDEEFIIKHLYSYVGIYCSRYKYCVSLVVQFEQADQEFSNLGADFIRAYRLVERLSRNSVYACRESDESYIMHCNLTQDLENNSEASHGESARYLKIDGIADKRYALQNRELSRYDFTNGGRELGLIFTSDAHSAIEKRLDGKFYAMDTPIKHGLRLGCNFDITEQMIRSMLPEDVKLLYGLTYMGWKDYWTVLKSEEGYVRCIFTQISDKDIIERTSVFS